MGVTIKFARHNEVSCGTSSIKAYYFCPWRMNCERNGLRRSFEFFLDVFYCSVFSVPSSTEESSPMCFGKRPKRSQLLRSCVWIYLRERFLPQIRIILCPGIRCFWKWAPLPGEAVALTQQLLQNSWSKRKETVDLYWLTTQRMFS